MTQVKVAAVQMSCSPSRAENVEKAEALVRRAAAAGAQIVLLQELFETPYFPQAMEAARYGLALPAEGHPTLARFQALAAELELVLPVSFFEAAGNAYFNALAVFDADGRNLGLYRKTHIPDAPGYLEKYYFSPGDTGFRVWPTRYGTIGVGICWDQWFPEAARIMAMKGAEILLYPTAIGSDVDVPESDSCGPWRRAMQGHAASNVCPVVAANRVGREAEKTGALEFFGSSFITDETGAILAEAGRAEETVVVATLDLAAVRARRARWGLFRDRRPEHYQALLTLDGGM